MDGHNSVWILAASIVGCLAAIPFVLQVVTKVRHLSYEILVFRGLSVSVKERVSCCRTGDVVAKVAFTRKEDMIVEEITVLSKLAYPRRFQGILAWLQLAVGYISDDVEGLNTVLGRSCPYIGIIAVPIHRVRQSQIRRPLSVFWGMILLFYFVVFLFPLFWPLLLWGPYQELRLFSGDADVRVWEQDSKEELERPFVLRSGFEKRLAISYRPSSVYYTFLTSRISVRNADLSYVKQPFASRGIRLPRNGEFNWKATDVLRIKVNGKVSRYPVKLGASYVSLHL